jgi:hypothetical protein
MNKGFPRLVWNEILKYLPQRWWFLLKQNKMLLKLINARVKRLKEEKYSYGHTHFSLLETFLRRGLIESFKAEFCGKFNQKIINILEKTGYSRMAERLLVSPYALNYTNLRPYEYKKKPNGWAEYVKACRSGNKTEIRNIIKKHRVSCGFRMLRYVRKLDMDLAVFIIDLLILNYFYYFDRDFIRKLIEYGDVEKIKYCIGKTDINIYPETAFASGKIHLLKNFGYWTLDKVKRADQKDIDYLFAAMKGNQPDLVKFMFKRLIIDPIYFVGPIDCFNAEIIEIIMQQDFFWDERIFKNYVPHLCAKRKGIFSIIKVENGFIDRKIKCASCSRPMYLHFEKDSNPFLNRKN